MPSFVDEGLPVGTGISMGSIEVTVAATTTRPGADANTWQQVVKLRSPPQWGTSP